MVDNEAKRMMDGPDRVLIATTESDTDSFSVIYACKEPEIELRPQDIVILKMTSQFISFELEPRKFNHRTKATIKNLFLDVFILPNLYQLTIGVGNGPAGPSGRPARSLQGRPNRFRGRYVHGMRLAASSCKCLCASVHAGGWPG